MIGIVETHCPHCSTVPIAAGPRLAGPAASRNEEQFLSPTLASWAKSRRSVFLRKQDREDASGHVRISRIGRAAFELRVVAVDLPEDRLAGALEAAEVVFAMRITLLVELLEGTNALGNRGLRILRQSADAARNEDLPASERSPEGVVLCRNGHKSEIVRADKVDLSRSTAPERSPSGGRPSARSRARPLIARCACHTVASAGAVRIRMGLGPRSARVTRVSSSSALEGRTHNVTPGAIGRERKLVYD